MITRHPVGSKRKGAVLRRFLSWQLGSRLLGKPVALEFVGGSRMLARTGMTGVTVNHYVGLYEFEDMAFVLHALRPDDFFLDVGANVGFYSVLAGVVVGASGIAFEPVPATFGHLRDNVYLNDAGDRVRCVNAGVGASEGTLHFTASLDAVNHVAPEGGADTVAVPVVHLDGVDVPRPPTLVKVDVEGWETNVVAGADALLSGSDPLALIIELNGSGARYGFDEAALHDRIMSYGLVPVRYAPFERTLTELDGTWTPLEERGGSTVNTLFVRDLDFFRARVAGGAPVDLLGLTV